MTAITKIFQTSAGGEVVFEDSDLGIATAGNRAVVNIFVAVGNGTGTTKTIQVSTDGTNYYPIYTLPSPAYTSVNIKNLMLKAGCHLKIASVGAEVLTGVVTGFYETDE